MSRSVNRPLSIHCTPGVVDLVEYKYEMDVVLMVP